MIRVRLAAGVFRRLHSRTLTHHTQETLRPGTRVIVLAKESPERGSVVKLDLAVPDPCFEEEIPGLVQRLESGAGWHPAAADCQPAV